MPDPIATYEELGEYIRRNTPYDDKLGVNMGVIVDPFTLDPATEMDGALTEFSLDKEGVDENGDPIRVPNNFPSPTLSDDQQQLCCWWYFQGKLIRVTKAMRVPYVFTRKNQSTGQDERIVAQLLIGYTGPSA